MSVSVMACTLDWADPGALLAALAAKDLRALTDGAAVIYTIGKFAAPDGVKALNLDGFDESVRLANAGVIAFPEDREARKAYGEAALRALSLHHFLRRGVKDTVLYLGGPMTAEAVSRAIDDCAVAGRPFEQIRHGLDPARRSSFVCDPRSPLTRLAVATTLRLYQTGAAAALPSRAFDYALGAALAAGLATAPASRAAMAEEASLRALTPSLDACAVMM